MNRARWLLAPALGLVLFVSPALAAEDSMAVVGTTMVPFEAEPFEGSQHRERLQEVVALRGDARARWKALKPALAFCDRKNDSTERTWVSVSTQAERDELMSSRSDANYLAFVDIACPRAYGLAAYFAAEEGDTGKAVAWLDRAQKLAPFSATPITERAFLHNAAGERQQALAAYRRALDLAERYPSSADMKAVALRGIGWTLVELGDFAGARQAFEQSLVVEPRNQTALSELAYLDGLEAKGGQAPSSPPFAAKATKGNAVVPALPAHLTKVLDLTRLLETQPFHPQARETRASLTSWLTDSTEVSVTACNTLGLLGDDDIPHGSELFMQSLFGAASHLIEHPGDTLQAEQLAGVKSALRAYEAILRNQPDAHVASLDALLRQQSAGELEAAVDRLVAEHCTE